MLFIWRVNPHDIIRVSKREKSKKVVESLIEYSKIHSEAFQIKMNTVRGKLLSDSFKEI